MRHSLSGGRRRKIPAVLPLVIFLLLSLPLTLLASESCSMMGGKCRDACAANEQAESGAFEDCGAKQECCVARAEAQVRCCIFSFDAKDHGRANCRAPEGGACAKGSASPVSCENLPMCRERQ